MIRLQKFLAHQDVASRRSIEKMIAEGRISVNGKQVTEQGTKIDPDKDKVSVDGKPIKVKDELVYYWLNKPVGYLSAASSKYGESTVADLVKSTKRIYPVGRLDKDSQGLILLTNDGELTHRLTHPKFHLDKTYVVQVVGNVTDSKLEKLRTGIDLEEGRTLPALVNQLENDVLEFIIHEGKHRQIRRMCAAVRLHVSGLIRVQFGPIKLGKLQIGEFRIASKQEIETLKRLVGLSDGGEQKVVDED
jgi:23S rRNA pseudouridine2605 synthase